MKIHWILIFLAICLISSCNSPSDKVARQEQVIDSLARVKKDSDSKKAAERMAYIKKYAGGYTIEVNGVSSVNEVEAYALNENGQAKWMWIEIDGRGNANLTSKKKGTWTANGTEIRIEIQSNSGLIIENYMLQNGIFVNTLIKDRYLKPMK